MNNSNFVKINEIISKNTRKITIGIKNLFINLAQTHIYNLFLNYYPVFFYLK